ncbi:MAG: tetratricopeptide repeat protein [Deltaproteobacteria bacterium]|nr:tetratricopeptide repeat protein [Deltaproteobacteria bacterium]
MVRTRLAVITVAVAILLWGGTAFSGESGSSLANDTRWQQARKELAQGKAGEAKAVFEELLKQYPNEADLQLFLGISLLRLRDPERAVAAIKKALAIDANHVEAHTLLGYVELEVRGDVNAALREYRRVIELKPDRAEAYANLAAAQKRQGDLEPAVASLNKALELKPAFALALTTRGGIFAEQYKWTEARRDFDQALKLNPGDDGALYGLSQALREAKDYAGAQQALSELIARSPNFVYWLEWGRIGMIRYWWVLLTIAVLWGLKSKFMKARTEVNG